MIFGVRYRAAAVVSALAAAVPALGIATVPAASAATAAPSHLSSVLVRAASTGAAAAAVRSVGGHVTVLLPIIDGVAAEVPSADLPALEATPGVAGVTPDSRVTVASTTDTSTSTNTVTSDPSVYRQQVGADQMASQGDTGQGSVVALIDTGITPMDDLAGRLVTGLENPANPNGPTVSCINLSTDPTCNDSYGHGTFMAGLIAGTGADSNGTFAGVAPGARLVSVKVAGADGSTDLARVLAGIQWVVSFKSQYGISVLNLALGTAPNGPSSQDPLDLAVEKAWNSGLAVIVAAGNVGPSSQTITDPGEDPLVITVGSTDDMGQTNVSADRVPDFTSRGPTAADHIAKPDVVAPGSHIIGLDAPNSYLSGIATEPDLQAPNYDGAYRRGSGTSMSTAMTAGVAALLHTAWSSHPGFSAANWPDEVKHALATSALPVAMSDPMAVGSGSVDAPAAVSAPFGLADQGSAGGSQNSSTGYFAQPWTPNTWYSTQGQSWEGQSWEGQSWEGQSWEGQSWEGQSWEGQSWEGQSWEGQSWEGQSWEGQSWEEYTDPNVSYGTPVAGSASYGAWG